MCRRSVAICASCTSDITLRSFSSFFPSTLFFLRLDRGEAEEEEEEEKKKKAERHVFSFVVCAPSRRFYSDYNFFSLLLLLLN